MDNLSRLRSLFNDGHELTLIEIRNRLGLSERQVRRLIENLQHSGCPVEERRMGRIKVFSLDEKHRTVSLIGLQFEEQELLALTVAAHAAQAVLERTPMGPPIQSAFEKLLREMEGAVYTFEPSHQHWLFNATTSSNFSPEVFEKVTRAINESSSIRIDYFAASSMTEYRDLLIDPYLIAVCGSSWLLTAYCHQTRSIIDYSLAGISSVRFEEAGFVRLNDFDPEIHFRDRFSALKGDRVYEVRLHVAPDKAPYFDRKIYHPTQQIEATEPDGASIISYEVSGLQEIAAFIRSWGPGVVVLDPPELVELLERQTREVLESYRRIHGEPVLSPV